MRMPADSTGFYLAESLSPGVTHIYDPNGYTGFYIHESHIYGPDEQVPWDQGDASLKSEV